MSTNIENILIVGSGSAGLTAAIYAARAGFSPLVLTGIQPGGQLTITTDVENYPGFQDVVQGPWLMEQMQKQAENVGARIEYDLIVDLDKDVWPFKVKTDSGKEIQAETIIIATGAQARWLGIESEEKYNGKGVSACATCDGFFYKDQEVMVVGGGNTAAEEALYLSRICSKVHLIHRRDKLRAEKILQDRIFAAENEGKIQIHWNSNLKEVIGDDSGVTSAKISINDKEDDLNVNGIFIAIGHEPNTNIFKNQLKMEDGYILIKSGLDGSVTSTSMPGVFAAGDVSDQVYRQAVTSAGFGCMAALDAEKYLAE